MTFPFVDMTWLDSNGKYHILSWMSTLEIITIFMMKPSYLIIAYVISLHAFRIFTWTSIKTLL